MFRLIAILLMAIVAFERTRAIIAAGHTSGDPGYSKATDPLGFWVITLAHAFIAALCILGALWLIYAAVAGAGPYADGSFFSVEGQLSFIILSLMFAVLVYLTFAKRLRRALTDPPKFRRKTFRQKRRPGK